MPRLSPPFATDLAAHRGTPKPFRGVHQHEPCVHRRHAEGLPKAQITFDKFHVVKLINEVVDEVCRAEQKSRTELNKNRYRFRDAGTRCGYREVN